MWKSGHSSELVVFLGVILLLSVVPPVISSTTIESSNTGPYLDTVLCKVIEGDDQQVTALLNNEVDLIGDWVDPTHMSTLMSTEDVQIETNLRNGYGYITINCAKYPLNITAFRRAAAFALERASSCG